VGPSIRKKQSNRVIGISDKTGRKKKKKERMTAHSVRKRGGRTTKTDRLKRRSTKEGVSVAGRGRSVLRMEMGRSPGRKISSIVGHRTYENDCRQKKRI